MGLTKQYLLWQYNPTTNYNHVFLSSLSEDTYSFSYGVRGYRPIIYLSIGYVDIKHQHGVECWLKLDRLWNKKGFNQAHWSTIKGTLIIVLSHSGKAHSISVVVQNAHILMRSFTAYAGEGEVSSIVKAAIEGFEYILAYANSQQQQRRILQRKRSIVEGFFIWQGKSRRVL